METQTLHTTDMPWETTTDFPGTAKAKILRDDGARKARSVLIRLDAGGRAIPHSHVGTVQHYVLEGEYKSDGKIYGAGTYRLLPEHAEVPEISTENGVTILMVYDPVA